MSETPVTAFCPGHISGYFKRVAGADLATTGSIGAGIVISEGVTATAVPSDTTSICIRDFSKDRKSPVTLNSSPPLSFVLERLGVHATVVTECNLPIGAGFGLSAAALLSTLTAVNHLLGLDLSPHDIALIAHEAEVVHRTGLGDVSACQAGGRVLRKGPGIDAEIERRFDIREPMYAICFGPIHTPSVLGSPEQMERVSAAFPPTHPDSPAGFFNLSRQFTRDSGLMTDQVKKVLDICEDEGVLSSMTMLGNGVFACGKNAKEVLSQFGSLYEFRMAESGAGIVGEMR